MTRVFYYLPGMSAPWFPAAPGPPEAPCPHVHPSTPAAKPQSHGHPTAHMASRVDGIAAGVPCACSHSPVPVTPHNPTDTPQPNSCSLQPSLTLTPWLMTVPRDDGLDVGLMHVHCQMRDALCGQCEWCIVSAVSSFTAGRHATPSLWLRPPTLYSARMSSVLVVSSKAAGEVQMAVGKPKLTVVFS